MCGFLIESMPLRKLHPNAQLVLVGLMDKKQQSGGGMMPPGAQFVPDIWSNVPSMEL